MTAAAKRELGSVWGVKATKDTRVEFVRPDGEKVTVVASNGEAAIVLDVPGDYSSGEQTVTAG